MLQTAGVVVDSVLQIVEVVGSVSQMVEVVVDFVCKAGVSWRREAEVGVVLKCNLLIP